MATTLGIDECSFCLLQDSQDPNQVQKFSRLSGRSRDYFAKGFCSILNLPHLPYHEEILDLPFCLSCYNIIRSATFIIKKLDEFKLKAIKTRNEIEELITKGQNEANLRSSLLPNNDSVFDPPQYPSFNFRQKIISRLNIPTGEGQNSQYEQIEIEILPDSEIEILQDPESHNFSDTQQENESESQNSETPPEETQMIRLISTEDQTIIHQLTLSPHRLDQTTSNAENDSLGSINIKTEIDVDEFSNPNSPLDELVQSDEDFHPEDTESESETRPITLPIKRRGRPKSKQRSVKNSKIKKLSAEEIEILKNEALQMNLSLRLKRVEEMSHTEIESEKLKSNRKTPAFIHKNTLSGRVKYQIKGSKYKCLAKGCGKLFDKKTWDNHVWLHQPIQLKCPICSMKINYPLNLRRHLAQQHEEKDTKVFEEYMKNYLLQNPTAPNFRLSGKTAQSDHQYTRTPKDTSNSKDSQADEELNEKKRCPECGRSVKVRNYEKHMEVHYNRDFPCDVCGKSFPNLRACKSHKKVVHTEDVLTCEHCGICFKTLYNLKSHIELKHEEPEPKFKCDECEYSSVKRYQLDRHKRSHSNNKLFHCTIGSCDKGYKHKHELMEHLRVHTGEKPYVCVHCGRGFRTRQLLRVHEQIHSKEESHVCPLCQKSFKVFHYLYVHVRKHKESDEARGIENSLAVDAMLQISRSRANYKKPPKFTPTKSQPHAKKKAEKDKKIVEEKVRKKRTLEIKLKPRNRKKKVKVVKEVEVQEVCTLEQIYPVETIEYEFEEIYESQEVEEETNIVLAEVTEVEVE